MGFNHCYLTNVLDLQRNLDNVGLETFIKMYRSYDALTGPSECFEFIEENKKIEKRNSKEILKDSENIDKNKTTLVCTHSENLFLLKNLLDDKFSLEIISKFGVNQNIKKKNISILINIFKTSNFLINLDHLLKDDDY